MKTLYVNPLNQQIVYQDPIYKPAQVWVMDQLDQDLTFKKEIGKSRGNEDGLDLLKRLAAQREFKSRDIKPVEAGGWVKISTDNYYSYQDVWPLAMQKLGQAETLKLQTP